MRASDIAGDHGTESQFNSIQKDERNKYLVVE